MKILVLRGEYKGRAFVVKRVSKLYYRTKTGEVVPKILCKVLSGAKK